MKEIMKKRYSIKELCQLTSVSVRTLHYYDEINILKPKYRTSKGHRWYSDNELLRLQQILALKFVGLTLTQIKEVLNAKECNYSALQLRAKPDLSSVF